MKKAVKKSAMELVQMLEDLQREAALPISCSQASAVSESWYIDNNPLMAACEGNADFDWKFDSVEAEFGTKDDLMIFDPFCAKDLAFSSSVALSPPTSPYEKQINDIITMGVNEKLEVNDSEADNSTPNECDSIIKDIFEPASQEADSEKRRIDAIEQWLIMATSSQGNEYLSSQESVAKETKEVDSEPTTCDILVAEELQDSDVIIEPDVSQVVALPVAAEEESPVVDSRLRRKRTLDYSKVHSPSSEPSPKRTCGGKKDKKKDQNKEAAKRYRDRKKKESMDFKQQCDELERKNGESREKIKDALKARQVLLDLWISLDKEKTNTNFSIKFPSWM